MEKTPMTVQLPAEIVEEVLELLSEREWYNNYNPRYNYCMECGANVKGSGIPKRHNPSCTWERCFQQLQKSLQNK